MLSVLYEDAQEEERDFEVVYVSSDLSAADCQAYMKQKHGDWLKIAYGSEQRAALKRAYGVFAGREQRDFPGVERKSGIPTLVVVSKEGEAKVVLDCDDPKVLREIESKGVSFLDAWEAHKW